MKKLTPRQQVPRVLCAAVGVFVLLNLLWFGFRQIKYSQYTAGMEQTVFSSFLVPRYALQDSDGFDYSVKFPDYLSATGNLAVGFPSDGDDPFTDALIIWPKPFGGYEFGVLLYGNGHGYQICIDACGNPLDPADADVVQSHMQNISTLLEKADALWNLTE